MDRKTQQFLAQRRGKSETVDTMFVLCCKEEIAAGETVTIVVPDQKRADALAEAFTDEELESVRFQVGGMPGVTGMRKGE